MIARIGAAALLALLAAAAWANGGATAGATALRDRVRAWRVAHEKEIVGELVDLLALPNVATSREDLEANARHLVAMLERRGIAARVLRAGEAPPTVYGELRVPGAKRTVVFYSHVDGQPADPAQWRSHPWRPVLRTGPLPTAAGGEAPREVDLATVTGPLDPEWRLFARAASDDKGPIVGVLAALDALRAAGVEPSVNLKFFYEAEEEAGSTHLREILRAHRELLAADAWIFADGPVHQTRQYQVVYGARGVVGLELTVYGATRALHSGNYGNWAPNPALLVAQLVAGMRDAEGRILIPGFYDDVRPPTELEKRAAAAVPPVEEALMRELGLAASESGGRLQDRVMLPALNVRGLAAGDVGEKARNAIPTEAHASLDFRLVPDQTPERVQALVEEHVRRAGFHVVREAPNLATRLAHPRIARLVWDQGYPAARTSMELPVSRAVAAIVGEAVGQPAIETPTLGGSLPLHLFAESLRVPLLVVPMVNHDNNQHAADENLRLQNLWDGIEIYALLMARLGEEWR
ncbi:MAG TPA: M20/M25/M40 family metallo-hydrolase [Thermoanaerobaculia bacterium]|nr:M20/M25/M40 family metallo-hydrolase [Thermoanaerobaculia bacterium]